MIKRSPTLHYHYEQGYWVGTIREGKVKSAHNHYRSTRLFNSPLSSVYVLVMVSGRDGRGTVSYTHLDVYKRQLITLRV